MHTYRVWNVTDEKPVTITAATSLDARRYYCGKYHAHLMNVMARRLDYDKDANDVRKETRHA